MEALEFARAGLNQVLEKIGLTGQVSLGTTPDVSPYSQFAQVYIGINGSTFADVTIVGNHGNWESATIAIEQASRVWQFIVYWRPPSFELYCCQAPRS